MNPEAVLDAPPDRKPVQEAGGEGRPSAPAENDAAKPKPQTQTKSPPTSPAPKQVSAPADEYGSVFDGTYPSTPVDERTKEHAPISDLPYGAPNEEAPQSKPKEKSTQTPKSQKPRKSDSATSASNGSGSNADQSSSDKKAPAGPPTNWSEFFEPLVARANAGDKEALKKLRAVLDEHSEIWTAVGDLGDTTQKVWIDRIADGNALIMDSVSRRIAEMKVGLAGPNPTAMESLLAEQIIITWLQSRHADLALAQATPGSLAQVAAKRKHVESANRRYYQAMKTLATVRKLAPSGLGDSGGLHIHRPTEEPNQQFSDEPKPEGKEKK